MAIRNCNVQYATRIHPRFSLPFIIGANSIDDFKLIGSEFFPDNEFFMGVEHYAKVDFTSKPNPST